MDLYAKVMQLYGRQSHAIDSGDGAAWADTFVADGVFDSPTYPRPIRGAQSLRDFVRDFDLDCRRERVVVRHVISNVWVDTGRTPILAHAYLQIIATRAGGVETLRFTRIEDTLGEDEHGDLRVVRRVVRPDAPTTGATGVVAEADADRSSGPSR